MTTTLATTHAAAVVMNILRSGQPDYVSADLEALMQPPGPRKARAESTLRVVSVGTERITKELVIELEGVARRLMLGNSGNTLRQQLKANFNQRLAPRGAPVWFSYEVGKTVRRLADDEVASTALAWSALVPAALRREASVPTHEALEAELQHVLVAFEQGDTADVDALWIDFVRSLTVTATAEVRITAPTASPVQAAIARRDELLALGWPTSAEVGLANGSRSTNMGQWAKEKRARGELLGVWSPQEKTYRHPAFQFRADGTLRPRLKELLDALATHEDFTPQADRGGWRRAFWLQGAVYALAGPDGTPRVPAEVFALDPERVIRAAEKDAEADLHESW